MGEGELHRWQPSVPEETSGVVMGVSVGSSPTVLQRLARSPAQKNGNAHTRLHSVAFCPDRAQDK